MHHSADEIRIDDRQPEVEQQREEQQQLFGAKTTTTLVAPASWQLPVGSQDDGDSNVERSTGAFNGNGLKYLPRWPPVNIEFQDVSYSVPDFSGGKKVILRGVSGAFRSGQLTAILGPSGAGKTTLLNVMAGFKTAEASGTILVNGHTRDMRSFRKMSRYIMQQSLYQPHLTVREAMQISADLKLGSSLNSAQKNEVIDEILELLRLTKTANTKGNRLSGGECKRLSIALELVNNPPVIFLDEPTTGLDDLSCAQCMQLLRRIAQGGRTVICSIHTPSAKIFAMFDHVYIVAGGQCAYQGHGANIVAYMQNVGLSCPLTYNPADFIVEVSAGEYGPEYVDRMIALVENGKCISWTPSGDHQSIGFDSTVNNNYAAGKLAGGDELLPEWDANDVLRVETTNWQQFCILYKRRTIQMYRDSSYLKLKIYMNLFLAVVVSGLFQGVGNDASKAMFNFGFCYTVTIAFLYNPLMPVLLTFPSEIELVKREHFNKWFRIGPYYYAMILAKLPIHLAINICYIAIIYVTTDQPLELHRMAKFFSVALLIGMTSESLGTLISSRLSLVNSMFVGPVITVPLMLLAIYDMGSGHSEQPFHVRLMMSLSYLRYGLEGIMAALYGYDRGKTRCPETEVYCTFANSDYLLNFMGYGEANFGVAMAGLTVYYMLFTVAAYFMVRMRIERTQSQYLAVQYLGRLVPKLGNHFNFSSHKY